MDYTELLNEIYEEAEPAGAQGTPAEYLAGVHEHDPGALGIAIATVDGSVHTAGAVDRPFSIQSVSKVFALALALTGGDHVFRRVNREPSGDPFNSLVLLEHEGGVPRNPFINAGALTVTDHLLSVFGESYTPLEELLRAESGNPDATHDPAVLRAELDHSHRSAALAHFMAACGNLEHDVDRVLDHYFRQCSISMNCADLARAGLVLARHGISADGSRLLTPSQAKRINALMLTCGTYDAAGEFAYRVGLPGKSGVSGAILAVIPQRGAVCVFGPRLDGKGNSVAGVAALDALTTRTGWSIF